MTESIIPNDELKFLAKKQEPQILNLILKDKNALTYCVESGITPDYFWIDKNRFLYKVALDNYKKYNSLLTRTAMDNIMDMQTSYSDEQKAARKMYWDEVFNLESSLDDFELLKNAIANRYIQQQAYNILQSNLEKVVSATTKQNELVEKIQTEFGKINGLSDNNYILTMGIKEGMEEAMKLITEKREHPESHSGVFCGIKALDDLFSGFLQPSYTIITGMPGGGKTTLMFNIGFNMAKKGHNVVYVSLEKQAKSLFSRLLALHALLDYNRIKKGGKESWGLPDHIYDLFQKASDDIVNNIKPNFDCIQMPPKVKMSSLLAEVDKIKEHKKAIGEKIDVLIVDYIGIVTAETFHPTRPDLDLADVSQTLQAYGARNKLATITAAQLKSGSTKEIRKKAKKISGDGAISDVKVNTEDIGGTQMMMFDCDNSMGVVLDEDDPHTKMFVSITKARDNESHKTIVLDFDGKLGRVSDPEMEPGQIENVDDLIYNSNLESDDLIKKLESEDDLFGSLDENFQSENDKNNSGNKTAENNSYRHNNSDESDNELDNELDDVVMELSDDDLSGILE